MNVKPPTIVYHVAGMGNWKEVVEEQLTLLRECGLAEAEKRITYLGDECGWLETKLKDYGIRAEIIYNDSNLAHCETIAMQEVERIAKHEESENPILYFHTKGVSNPGDWCKQQWRKLMQEHVIRQWKLNLLHLKDHDAVGVNWHENGTQHFSGTMWIANTNWIRRLPKFTEYHARNGSHRYTCEMWIGAAEWCRAKSLACRNEPFWNAWYDFGRFLPPAVPGHFDYRGTDMQQPVAVLDVLPPLLRELKPARVLEIGTGDAGFIRFVRHTLNDLGMADVPTTSVDVAHRDSHLIAKKEGSNLLTFQPFHSNYSKVHEDLIKFVQGSGVTAVFCDGSSPAKEFGAMTKVAKVGDVIFAHDYAPDRGEFDRRVNGKIWNWLETTDADLEQTVNRFEMKKWKHDELLSAAWCGYSKGCNDKAIILPSSVSKGKIGLGILTYKRPLYFERVMESVLKVIDKVDVVYIYNDGSPGVDYYKIYAKFPDKVRVCHADINLGVAHGKNHLISALLTEQCEYLFLMEDDIIIRDGNVFRAYIDSHVPNALEHLNFAHHGPANESGPVDRFNDGVELYTNIVGAFSFYTNRCIQSVGLMDTEFKNVWEHVEHTARIAEAGLTTPFWRFADIVNSEKYLEEIPGSIDSSDIRKSEKWEANIKAGLEHWKNDLATHCPL